MNVEVVVASCEPLRKILYPATPTLSVEAVQLRSIWDEDIVVAVNPVGIVGGVVSVVPPPPPPS